MSASILGLLGAVVCHSIRLIHPVSTFIESNWSDCVEGRDDGGPVVSGV